jgi:hypothetical protein
MISVIIGPFPKNISDGNKENARGNPLPNRIEYLMIFCYICNSPKKLRDTILTRLSKFFKGIVSLF